MSVAFKYEASIVSYFDILGMKELLVSAKDDAEKIATILRFAQELSKPSSGVTQMLGWTFTNFSDLIVRTVPILTDINLKHRPGLVFNELQDLAHIQANLISRNILVRGAVTIGNIAVDRGLIFGPALVEAYRLESQLAVYPRIIVDPDLMQAVRAIPVLRSHDADQEWNYLRDLVRRDADNTWFLDYLSYARHNSDNNAEYVEFLVRHHTLVINQLRDSENNNPGQTTRDKQPGTDTDSHGLGEA